MNIDPKEFRERAIKDAKCALILDAARKLFAQKGYWETRLEDIAAAAGFSKASLYNYYIDKEAIFLSIVIIENKEMMEKIKAVLDNPQTFIKTLKSVFEIIFKAIHDDYGIMVNFQNMMAMHANMLKHKELVDDFIASLKKFTGLLAELIRRARHSGEISSDLDDEALARFIGMLVRGAIFEWNISPKRMAIDSTIAQILTFVKQGAGVVT